MTHTRYTLGQKQEDEYRGDGNQWPSFMEKMVSEVENESEVYLGPLHKGPGSWEMGEDDGWR